MVLVVVVVLVLVVVVVVVVMIIVRVAILAKNASVWLVALVYNVKGDYSGVGGGLVGGNGRGSG